MPIDISYNGSSIYTSSSGTDVKLLTSGKFMEDDVLVSIPVGTEGNPTATKGTVTSNSVSVTPSVYNSEGYISGGNHTGTAVTVSASELVSGTKTISASGTTDVTNYANASVASGSATTPATTITANPSISVSSSGLITASVSASQNVTPTVSAGYVSSGTAGSVAVSGSNTSQLSTQAAQTITPTTTAQTIASGKYLTGAQTVEAVICENLTASNIVSGVTVKVGTATDDDSVASVTGTASSGYDETLIKNYISRSSSFTDITWPSGLSAIGMGAFMNCTSFNPSSLPSTLSYIDSYAFYECTSLSLTSLPSSVGNIGAYAFYNCTNLALTSLPATTAIQNYSFYNCGKLALSSLPNAVTKISDYAFYRCISLTISSLPAAVSTIGNNAFARCSGLTSISCTGAITTLGNTAFNGNSSYPMSLTSASFPNLAITSALNTVFGNTTAANACQLLEFADIGNAAGIGTNAFANCYALETLVIRKTGSICSLSNVSAFLNTPMRGYNSLTGTVYVPSALISSYQGATNWSTLYTAGTITFSAIEGSDYELD